MPRFILLTFGLLVAGFDLAAATPTFAQATTNEVSSRKIVLIAGPITGHPKQTHEYEKNVILLKHLLDHAENLEQIETEIHFQGWPQDESTLDDADTIVFISDGSDRNESDHPLYVGDRFQVLKRQMDRGCGLVMFHWSTFHPRRAHDEIIQWVGGYFDYESGPAANGWYSAIQTWQSDVSLPNLDHPISRGIKPFRVQEEFYYRLRFATDNPDNSEPSKVKHAIPILATTPPGESDSYTVGWAVERENGGRGFGFTGGHFYRNWWDQDFRRAILNAIIWTAGVEVPEGGVQSKLDEPIRMLIVTGYHSPHHDWNKVTGALIKVLEQDPRVFVEVTEDVEDLGRGKLSDFDMLVFNYCNWDRDGLSAAAKQGLIDYLKAGGGMSVIHFANGSFTDTVPNPAGDWPEFRTRIVRRIWVHGEGKSSHDAYGPFRVKPTEFAHPITAGLEPFETYDELYFNQEGELPIEPLVTAHSRVTGKDEPMAWAYRYGDGRVFQTVLGHAEPSIIAAGALIRRGSVWASGHDNLTFDPPIDTLENYLWRDGAPWKPHEPTTADEREDSKTNKEPRPNEQPLTEGRFQGGLNAKQGGIWLTSSDQIREPPLTVAAWVRLENARSFNIIAASETKASLSHWELYTYAGAGDLSVYLPGVPPHEIRSGRTICDGEWHYVGFTYAPNLVTLYVDGEKVKETNIERPKLEPRPEALAIGALVEGTIGCAGTIDDLVVVDKIIELSTPPDHPHQKNDQTLVYFSLNEFNKEQGTFENEGKIASPGYVDRKRLIDEPQDDDADESAAARKKVEGHWGEDAIGFAWQEQDSVDDRWQQTDIGPCLAGTFPIGDSFCRKGLAIQIPSKDSLSACFDTEHLSWRGLWRNGFLKFDPARYGLIKHPQPATEPVFVLEDQTSWNADHQQWLGYQQAGRELALHYQIGKTLVREVPLAIDTEDGSGFVREITIQPHEQPLTLRLCQDTPSSTFETEDVLSWYVRTSQDKVQLISLISSSPEKLALEREDRNVQLRCRSSAETRTFQLVYWVGNISRMEKVRETIRRKVDRASGRMKIEHAFTSSTSTRATPATPLWNPPINMPIQQGSDPNSPYVVDTFQPPFENPYGALLFLSGHDFLPNGSAVVSTVHGDVWIVDGILQTQPNSVASWKRFATGLYQPLGVRVVDGQIFVLGRDQITRLHDFNLDGEADYYENFNNDGQTSTGTHDYAAGLESDPAGNFYYVRGNTGVERVSADGAQHDVIATGLRNPNGIGMNPSGVLTVAPQEGEWTPASSIAVVHEGDYFGYGGPRVTDDRPRGYDQPLCWLPRLVDNSSGGQCWIDNDRWGPLQNHWVHLSYGRCWMMLVLIENIAEQPQGGVVQFPFEFDSGVCRARFHPSDGQLYVSGLRGWSSSAVQDGCFQRVRYTGQPVRMPIEVKTVANGVILTFSQPLHEATANDRLNYFVERWNYRYSAAYGSPEYSVANPNRQGRDEVFVRSATLLDDNRSVFLELDDHRAVMQLAINYSLSDAQGQNFNGVFYHTVHQIGTNHETPGKHASGKIVDEQRAFEQRLRQGWLVDVRTQKIESSPADIESDVVADQFVIRNASIGDPSHFPVSPFCETDWLQLRLHGYLKLERPGTYRISISGARHARVQFADQELQLHASFENINGTATPICELATPNLSRGFVPIEITVDRSAIEGPLSVSWSGDLFAIEPISPVVLFHDPIASRLADFDLLRRGKSLFAMRGCVHCHGSRMSEEDRSPTWQAFELDLQAPSLEDIGNRLRPEWIRAWLLNPSAMNAHATMPRLLDAQFPEDVQKATAITAWLMKQSQSSDLKQVDLETSVEEGQFALGERLYERLGCISCHHLHADSKPDPYARRSLAGIGAKFQHQALVDFLQRPHRYHPTTAMPDFHLSDEEARSLVAFLLQELSPTQSKLPSLDFRQAASFQGEQVFEELGCRQCHITQSEQALAAPRLRLVQFTEARQGCLDPQAARSRHIPDLELSVSERRALLAFLRSNQSLRDDTPRESAERLLEHLNCLACHHRDGKQSRFAELVLDEGWSGLAPETLPDLTWAGEKLHSDWIERLLLGEVSQPARPWLEARMPAFPFFAGRIANGLAIEHAIDPRVERVNFAPDPSLAQTGHRLTLLQHGFDCRQCHGVGDEPPAGDEKTQLALGINFSQVQDRLRRPYYDRWMRDPLRIDPLTKMPKYTLENDRTKIETIFEGNSDRQFNAIWHYLQSIDQSDD